MMTDLGDHVADLGDHDRPIRAITIRRCMQFLGNDDYRRGAVERALSHHDRGLPWKREDRAEATHDLRGRGKAILAGLSRMVPSMITLNDHLKSGRVYGAWRVCRDAAGMP